MPRKRTIRRPTHDEIEQVAAPLNAFLLKMLAAADKAQSVAKIGYRQSGEQKYAGEIEYHGNCVSCIRWLLSHTASWARNSLTYVGRDDNA